MIDFCVDILNIVCHILVLQSVLNRTLIFAQKRSPDLVFDRLHTAYKRFDPIRGMDYRLMLRFMQPANGTVVLKR